MKYIDADKLIAEIERLQQEVRNKWKENPRSSIDDGFLTACSRFLDIIASLQREQPEVDWEKRKKDWHEENASHGAFALTQDEIDFYYKK